MQLENPADDLAFQRSVITQFKDFVGDSGRDYLILSELFQLKFSQFKVDFRHLGTLFLADTNQDGGVTLDELRALWKLCVAYQHSYPSHEFKMRIQGHGSMDLWQALKQENGKDNVVEWFIKILKRNQEVEIKNARVISSTSKRRGSNDSQVSSAIMTVGGGYSLPGTPQVDAGQPPRHGAGGDPNLQSGASESYNQQSAGGGADADHVRGAIAPGTLALLAGQGTEGEFLSASVVELVHEMFHVQATQGVNFQAFLDMLQQVGEQQGLMTLNDERYDEVVPLAVLRGFAAGFFDGVAELMGEIQGRGGGGGGGGGGNGATAGRAGGGGGA